MWVLLYFSITGGSDDGGCAAFASYKLRKIFDHRGSSSIIRMSRICTIEDKASSIITVENAQKFRRVIFKKWLVYLKDFITPIHCRLKRLDIIRTVCVVIDRDYVTGTIKIYWYIHLKMLLLEVTFTIDDQMPFAVLMPLDYNSRSKSVTTKDQKLGTGYGSRNVVRARLIMSLLIILSNKSDSINKLYFLVTQDRWITAGILCFIGTAWYTVLPFYYQATLVHHQCCRSSHCQTVSNIT
ncbi:hypothetical protein BDC45DRAFT_539769 [Circinella umbellata]|nr:hypothetical protein BDC45DRAFT_539769 [Circinella umbellata]